MPLTTAVWPSTVLGCQYESSIFAGRAPEGAVLLRAILGGTFDPGIVEESDDVIRDRTVADLRRLAGLSRQLVEERAGYDEVEEPVQTLGQIALGRLLPGPPPEDGEDVYGTEQRPAVESELWRCGWRRY